MTMDFSAGIDVLEHVAINNIIDACANDGVLSGLAVSQRGAGANMSVDVALGRAYISSTVYTESGTTNLVIAAAHATLYRKDLITYDPTTSNPVVTQGTDHAGGTSDPIYPPDIPAGDILLSIVEVDANASSITNGDITDCRCDIGAGAGKIHAYTASTTTLKSDTSEASTQSTTFVKLKTITAIPASVIRSDFTISFDLKISDTVSAYATLRRNGVDVGTPQVTAYTSYVNFSEDISDWYGGDIIELWVKSGNATKTAYVQNLYVKGTLHTITPISDAYSW